MGINFSRLLTLKYGPTISAFLKTDRTVLSVGRVMTCVLGMVVRREREIRDFVKTPFYRVIGTFLSQDMKFDAEWRSVEGPAISSRRSFIRKMDSKNGRMRNASSAS